ncbi:MAG: type IV toxin-antitoxin system AbiEi family antitoxin [Chitinispirillaceae bacterium]|nr:type IV toxin-antitoxin system AbiEi family antitoxin [Chitinispirillaceae bacterium]
MQDNLLKLKQLLPHGEVASRSWFLEQGFSHHTLDNFIKSRKLKLLMHGIYAWNDIPVFWQNVVASRARLPDDTLVVGGLTALSLQGYSHYLEMGNKKVHLYTDKTKQTTLKHLFGTIDNIQAVWHATGRLWSSDTKSELFVKNWKWQENSSQMAISTLERAVLEVVEMIPMQLSFEHVDQIFQGLTQLSPENLMVVLKNCRNVKVKRLFFWFADRHNYPWRKYLDDKDFNLGSGKRVIFKNGTLDSKYLITVPSEFQSGSQYV